MRPRLPVTEIVIRLETIEDYATAYAFFNEINQISVQLRNDHEKSGHSPGIPFGNAPLTPKQIRGLFNLSRTFRGDENWLKLRSVLLAREADGPLPTKMRPDFRRAYNLALQEYDE